MTQKFKGDSTETLFEEAGRGALDTCSAALSEYYAGAYTAGEFLLMLYDAGRMPFSDRVPRDSFLLFIKQAIPNFPFTGTFDSYLFILEAIFGAGTDVLFELTDPGKIGITVNAADTVLFEFIGREFVDGAYVNFELIDDSGDAFVFTGISGIDSQAELEQLLAELIPVGIVADITLTYFDVSPFIAEYEPDEFYSVVDHLDNQLVFFET